MSPLQIEILFHYYTRGNDYRDGDFTAPAVREAIDHFYDEEVLEGDLDRCRAHQLTERGKVYCRYVCSLNLPVKKWEMA